MRVKQTYIMGLNCAYHESAVSIIRDGELIAFIEEERLNRVKHAKQAKVDNADELPLQAINYCLQQVGISLADIGHIGYSLNPLSRLEKNINHNHPYKVTPNSFGTKEGEKLFYKKNLNVESKIRGLGFLGVFHYLDHHDCHAAGAYFSSGFKSSAILVVDGIGEYESTTWYKAQDVSMKKIGSLNFPNSLGLLWEKLSKFMGFNEYEAAKVMGLTSYGNPLIYKKKFQELVKVFPDGTFAIDDEIIQFRNEDYSKLEILFGLKQNEITIRNVDKTNQNYADLSATLQEETETILLKLIKTIRAETGLTSLCMNGGVALNCVANAKLIYSNIFENIYIHPPAHDAGTAIGAAFFVSTQILNQEMPIALQHAFLGSNYSNEETLSALNASNLKYSRIQNIEKVTAKLLSTGKFVAWFQDKMEAGPRALGHRSILADPRNKECLNIINEKVKLREPFRPLCPSILEEQTKTWIDIGDSNSIPDPAKYMLAAFKVNKDKKELIPAVVHIDNTSRIQTVSKKISLRYWKLINEFYKLTNVPVIMNTSFNIQEPIVCTPKDAIETFNRSKLDYLVIGDYLCEKI